ncbi:hypothetical protein ACGFMM_24645 [Streptomyces sp. NPDC048604]
MTLTSGRTAVRAVGSQVTQGGRRRRPRAARIGQALLPDEHEQCAR